MEREEAEKSPQDCLSMRHQHREHRAAYHRNLEGNCCSGCLEKYKKLRSALCTPSVSCIWDWRAALLSQGEGLGTSQNGLPVVSKRLSQRVLRLSWGMEEWGVQAVWKGGRLGGCRAWHSCGLG